MPVLTPRTLQISDDLSMIGIIAASILSFISIVIAIVSCRICKRQQVCASCNLGKCEDDGGHAKNQSTQLLHVKSVADMVQQVQRVVTSSSVPSMLRLGAIASQRLGRMLSMNSHGNSMRRSICHLLID